MNKNAILKEIEILKGMPCKRPFYMQNMEEYWKTKWINVYEDKDLVIDARIEEGRPQYIAIGQSPFVNIKAAEIYEHVAKKFSLKVGAFKLETQEDPLNNFGDGARCIDIILYESFSE